MRPTVNAYLKSINRAKGTSESITLLIHIGNMRQMGGTDGK